MDDARVKMDGLMKEKDALEAEAEGITAELESPPASGGPPPGVKTKLVDDEGYPRADIDLWRVRTLRNRLACIQTDHKAVMKSIEELLPVLLVKGAVEEKSDDAMDIDPIEPFALVNNVKENSPADRGGLQKGDHILRFGDVTTLQEVPVWTRSHVNEVVQIRIERKKRRRTLPVVPAKWNGDGLLGCHLLPV